jgi:hypothetical protein
MHGCWVFCAEIRDQRTWIRDSVFNFSTFKHFNISLKVRLRRSVAEAMELKRQSFVEQGLDFEQEPP